MNARGKEIIEQKKEELKISSKTIDREQRK